MTRPLIQARGCSAKSWLARLGNHHLRQARERAKLRGVSNVCLTAA